MATCPTCGSTVILGGVKDGVRRYCNKKCYAADEINRVADKIPNEQVKQLALNINNGVCPKCKKPGPVDIHKSYSVYSVIIYTKWQTNTHLLCKKCATSQQTVDLAASLLLGWWGFPFGLIITPIQIIRNIISMSRSTVINRPSEDLKQRAKLILAAKALEESN